MKKRVKRAENSVKVVSNFYCIFCDYTTSRKYDYDKHCLTAKHEKESNIAEKIVNSYANFNCDFCDYSTSRKSNYDRHILTPKHIKRAKRVEKTVKIAEQDNDFLKNLVIENMKLTASLVENQNKQQETTNTLTSNIVNITEKMTDIIKHYEPTNTISNNNINSNNNTVNQKFNLNLFLNEKCKDALNITEFIESIQLTLQDFLQTAQLGYTDGISKIINDKIKETGEEKRPFHCTDIKREVLYVKDNNIWEKEPPEKPKITKLIDGVMTKNFQKLTEYKEENPECDDITSGKGKEYFNIMCNLSGGNQSEREKKKDKIIKNLMKQTTIEKNENLLL